MKRLPIINLVLLLGLIAFLGSARLRTPVVPRPKPPTIEQVARSWARASMLRDLPGLREYSTPELYEQLLDGYHASLSLGPLAASFGKRLPDDTRPEVAEVVVLQQKSSEAEVEVILKRADKTKTYNLELVRINARWVVAGRQNLDVNAVKVRSTGSEPRAGADGKDAAAQP